MSDICVKIDSLKKFLICPISKKYFLNPVTLPNGITYEKTAILMYFEESKEKDFVRCPLTNYQIFDFDPTPDYNDNIKYLNPNTSIKEIVDLLFNDELINRNERFSLNLFELPICNKMKDNFYISVTESNIDILCDELKYSEYSIQELHENLKLNFHKIGRENFVDSKERVKKSMSKIYDALSYHLKFSHVTGTQDFLLFIDFCLKELYFLEYINLNDIFKQFDLKSIPIELLTEPNLVKVFNNEETFNLFLSHRKSEFDNLIISLDQKTFSEMLKTLILSKRPNSNNHDDVNYVFLNYIAKSFDLRFNQTFENLLGTYFFVIKKNSLLTNKEFDFLHLLKQRFNEKFTKSLNSDIISLLLEKYYAIKAKKYHIIGYFDVDQHKYFLKINPNYKNTLYYNYINKDSIFTLFGILEKSSNRHNDRLDFNQLQNRVNSFTENNSSNILETINYHIKLDENSNFYEYENL